MSEPEQKCENNVVFKQNCSLLLKWPILAVSAQGEIQIFQNSSKKSFITSTTEHNCTGCKKFLNIKFSGTCLHKALFILFENLFHLLFLQFQNVFSQTSRTRIPEVRSMADNQALIKSNNILTVLSLTGQPLRYGTFTPGSKVV